MWHKAAKQADIPSGKSQQLQIGKRQIALFNVEGKFHAIEGSCPHRGGPLGQGHLEGTTVRCPWHAWTFDVRSGECHNTPDGNRKTFAVKIEGEDVFVDVQEE